MFPDIAKCPLGDKVTPDRNHWVELYSGPKDGNGAPPSLGLTRNVEGRAWSCLKETDGLAKCLSLFGPGILRLYPSVDSHGGISSLTQFPMEFLSVWEGKTYKQNHLHLEKTPISPSLHFPRGSWSLPHLSDGKSFMERVEPRSSTELDENPDNFHFSGEQGDPTPYFWFLPQSSFIHGAKQAFYSQSANPTSLSIYY